MMSIWAGIAAAHWRAAAGLFQAGLAGRRPML